MNGANFEKPPFVSPGDPLTLERSEIEAKLRPIADRMIRDFLESQPFPEFKNENLTPEEDGITGIMRGARSVTWQRSFGSTGRVVIWFDNVNDPVIDSLPGSSDVEQRGAEQSNRLRVSDICIKNSSEDYFREENPPVPDLTQTAEDLEDLSSFRLPARAVVV